MTAEHPERLPTAEEIALDSLDGRFAIEHFHGKSLAEAEAMIIESCRNYNEFTHTEDLLWMEPAGFRFYVRAAMRAALSEHSTGYSDFINSLAGTISLWDEQHPDELNSCARLIAEFCINVVDQFDRFDADPQIYPGLREKYIQLAGRFFENSYGAKRT